MVYDLISIGAHPDDVEVGTGGVLIALNKKGYKTGIVYLTAGEMGTGGTPEIRAGEAVSAAHVMGSDLIYTYDWGDTRLFDSYEKRIEALLRQGLGLWDVYASCERQGSLDSAIQHPQVNNLAALAQHCPALKLIAHNGGESYRHARHTRTLGYPVVRLPSTSPANASWSFERKLAAWREVVALAGLV